MKSDKNNQAEKEEKTDGRGRPSKRCDFAIDVILEGVRSGDSLDTVCDSLESLPCKRTFLRWVAADPNLEQRWIDAMVYRALSYGEECVRIADTCKEEKQAIAKANLQIRARQWDAQRMQPKRYGRNGVVDEGASDSSLAARLKAARQRARGEE